MTRRILLLITDLQIGGTPTVVRELAVRLRDPGKVEVEVACLAGWGPTADQLREADVEVKALGARSPASFPLTLLRLISIIRGGRFDTVFSFLIHANAMAAAAATVCPEVRFLQSVQTTQPLPRWHWALQRIAQFAAERVIVPSASTAHVARHASGIPAKKITIIPNAVDVASFNGAYERRRPPGEVLQVGFIGRLDPIKCVPDLVAAMAAISDGHLHIFGEGADRSRIEAAVIAHRLSGRVTLYGAVAHPSEALAMLNVLVLPSAAEGFGLVLIEAMAAGVPVVATDVPGIRDVVRQGETGLLVPVNDPAALAAGIATVVGSEWRQRVVPAARDEVEHRFSWLAVLPQYRNELGLRIPGLRCSNDVDECNAIHNC